VAVGIQSDAQHDRLAFFLLRRVRHEFKLSAVAIGVKPQAQRVSGMSTLTKNEHFPRWPGFRKLSQTTYA
jgi:hypothetical protein